MLFERQASALEKIKWLLEMENAAPFTLNDHYYEDYREKFLKFYHEARFPSNQQYPPGQTREERIAKDPFSQALHHMAGARAYTQGSHLIWS